MPNPFITIDETIIREKIPVFAPKKIVEVSLGEEWIPDTGDVAFYSSEDTTITFGDGDSTSTYVNLLQGQVLGIRKDVSVSFTFSTNVTLLVM